MSASLQDLVVQQFEALGSDVRLVVLQPNFSAQHVILPALLRQSGCLYVRLEGADLSADAVREQIDEALSLQMPGAELASVDTLVLDEYDRAAPSARPCCWRNSRAAARPIPAR